MKLLSLLALSTLLWFAGSGVTYHVSPAGNDANDGKSLATAWKTLSYAASQENAGVIAAGSPVIVEAGTYHDQAIILNSTVPTASTTTPFQLPASGAAGAPVQWIANGTVIIDAADVVPTSGAGAVTWTLASSVCATCYQATFTQHPSKLYVNPNDQDTPQLMPQGNMVGVYSPSGSYNEYDIATQGTVSNITVQTAGTGMTAGIWPLTFTGGGCVGAYGYAQVQSDGVTTNPYYGVYGGRGCTSAPTVTFSTGTGTSPVLTATLSQVPYMVAPNNFNVVSQSSGTGFPWVPIRFPTATIDSQSFSPTNSGLQNVAAAPGSWYITPAGANWLVTVNLLDGSNPAASTLEATHRDTNITLSSVDYVSFSGFTGEHAFKQCFYDVAAADSSLGGNYWTGEYNYFANFHVFNCGNIGGVHDVINTNRSNVVNTLMGGIVVRPGAEPNAHFLRPIYAFAANGTVGTIDDLYGAGSNVHAGIALEGIDAGGNLNRPVIWNNKIQTRNSIGIAYETNAITSTNGGNLGGSIAFNEISNTIQGMQIGIVGGNIYQNFIHDGKGQGIQGGGPTAVATALYPLTIHNNVCANQGQAPYNGGYNCFDQNGATPGQYQPYIFNNTIYNAPDACVSFEVGVSGAHFYNNICDMNAMVAQTGTNVWPASSANGYGGTNGSSFLYMVSASLAGIDFHDNSYIANCATFTSGCAGNKFFGVASCATWQAYSGETGNTTCENVDPQFVNVAGGTTTANNFNLKATSPMIHANPTIITVNGQASSADRGAVPYGTTFPFVATAYPQPSASGGNMLFLLLNGIVQALVQQ